MALVINTNLSSIRAQMNLNRTQTALSTSLERISSGARINSPKDDSAGLAISQRMTADIKKFEKAIKNAENGTLFVGSADAVLLNITNKLQDIQALAVEAAKASQSPTDRGLLNNNVVTLRDDINRLADQAEFNGKKMLTGKIINSEFQVGLRSEQVIRVTIPLTEASSIGNYSIQTDNTRELAIGAPKLGEEQGILPGNFVTSQSITIIGASSGQTGSVIGVESGETAKSIADKINAVEAQTGVTAVARSYVTLEKIYDIFAAGEQKISFNLYGLNTKTVSENSTLTNSVSISARVTGQNEAGLRELVSAINSQVSVTGIRASTLTVRDEATGEDLTKVVLENGGSDISIEKFRNDQISGGSGIDVTSMVVGGLPGTQEVELIEGTDEDSVTVGGTITLNSFKTFTVTSDADEESSLFLSGSDGIFQTANFTSLASISLSTEQSVREALLVAASALDFISSLRGDLGAIQNRFVTAVSNLESVKENTEAAKSRILDTDFAEETASLTRAQVLQQAGIAILAQANTTPQAVLALLRT